MINQLEKYRALLPTYESYAKRLEGLLRDLMFEAGIRVHFTESRAKSFISLQDKVNRPGKSYKEILKEVPDLIGIRLLLYYQDDSVSVQKLISKEFEVLEIEKSHQPDEYSPDKFGYISTHFIVRLSRARAKLPEWKAFKDFHAEVQVRTVLQHSWAAISHALQYKREGDVPIALRRKLFRLAGLFELADEQFIELRDAAITIREKAHSVVQAKDDTAIVDSPILREILERSPDFQRLIEFMEGIGYEVSAEGEDNENYTGKCVEELERLNSANLGIVTETLREDCSEFFKTIYEDGWPVDRPFIFFLLLIYKDPRKFTVEYLLTKYDWLEERAERVISKANVNGEEKA